MMKHSINQLKVGVILAYINLAIGSIIPFFYTPVMLRILGQSEYGLFSLSNSVIGYLSLLNLGLGSTIIRYIAKFRAENDKESVQNVLGFMLLVYAFLALMVVFAGWGIAQNVTYIFEKGLSVHEINEIQNLILIMTFNTALAFPLSVFTSVTIAYEKYVFRRLFDILLTIITPLANLLVLYLGYGSIGMALAATIIQLLVSPINIVYCIKKLCLRPKFSKIQKNLIIEMIGFSVYVFIGTLVDMLFWSTDKVILGMLAGSTAVAVYNIGGTFNNIVMNLSSSISGVLGPRVTGMAVNNAKPEQYTDLFIKVGRLQFIVVALIVSGFTVFGQCFIKMWAGEAYKNSYWVAVLTLFPLCIPLIQNTGLAILMAQNKHKFRSIVYLVIAIINAISTYMVVPYTGVLGAALCSCVAYIAGQGVIMNWYYYKRIHIDIFLFWKNILKMSMVPILMSILSLAVIRYITMNSWIKFFIGVLLYTVIYVILMYLYAMDNSEKDIIRIPIKKLKLKN